MISQDFLLMIALSLISGGAGKLAIWIPNRDSIIWPYFHVPVVSILLLPLHLETWWFSLTTYSSICSRVRNLHAYPVAAPSTWLAFVWKQYCAVAGNQKKPGHVYTPLAVVSRARKMRINHCYDSANSGCFVESGRYDRAVLGTWKFHHWHQTHNDIWNNCRINEISNKLKQ
jgi:hypothetical protein